MKYNISTWFYLDGFQGNTALTQEEALPLAFSQM